MTRKPVEAEPGGRTLVSRCARCHGEFACGVNAPTGTCWCAGYPALPGPVQGKGCYCPRCLEELINTRQVG